MEGIKLKIQTSQLADILKCNLVNLVIERSDGIQISTVSDVKVDQHGRIVIVESK